MKYDLIKTDNYLLVVDNSEIKSIDWVYVEKYPEAPWKFMNPPCPMPYWGNKQEAKKIIAHLALNGAPYLDGVDVLPPTWRDGSEEDSVEQLAEEHAEHQFKGISDRTSMFECKNDFKSGYQGAREKYKFTEEDMLDAWELGAKEGLPLTRKKKEDLFNSLRQPKLPVAFECEVEPKFKNIGSTKEVKGSGSSIKNKHAGNPKTIINSEGRTEWVGKWIFEQPKPNV